MMPNGALAQRFMKRYEMMRMIRRERRGAHVDAITTPSSD